MTLMSRRKNITPAEAPTKSPRRHSRPLNYSRLTLAHESLVVEALKSGRPVWVLSDTHFGHRRLTEVLNPPARPMGYPLVDDVMRRNWWNTVRQEDLVLHLGDVFLEEITSDSIPPWMEHLPGEILVIADGNHDGQKKLEAMNNIGWKVIKPFSLTKQDRTVHFSHHPVSEEELPDKHFSVHGHVHTNFGKLQVSPRHRNVSVEVIDFTPQRLDRILDCILARDGVRMTWNSPDTPDISGLAGARG